MEKYKNRFIVYPEDSDLENTNVVDTNENRYDFDNQVETEPIESSEREFRETNEDETSEGFRKLFIKEDKEDDAQDAPMKMEKFSLLEERIEHADKKALDAYNKNKDDIRLGSYDWDKTALYNSNNRRIYFNLEEDLDNSLGKGSTYFHEVGHFIDHQSATEEGEWLSSNRMFKGAIQSDVNDYVQRTMNENKCSKEEAYSIISYELRDDRLANVSDIFGSVTDCKCQGYWGHDADYWKIEGKMEKEAFANMFESSMGIKYKAEDMKKYFPNAYYIFKELLEDI